MKNGLAPRFFSRPEHFRTWLELHHESECELIVGYYKVASGRESMTWSESVDQALCFGWVDGIRRRVDDERYCIRFTPRRKVSKWSDVNLKKVEVLQSAGLMHPAGLAAHERRIEGRRAGYSYEENIQALSKEAEVEFRSHAAAWSFFEGLPPSYRKKILRWLTGAKRQDTRARRLAKAIASFERGERLD